MKILLTLTIWLLIVGCKKSELFENKETPPPAVVVPDKVQLKSLQEADLKVRLIPLNIPNQYNAELSWPDFLGRVQIINETGQVISEKGAIGNTFTFAQLLGGSHLKFSILTFADDGSTDRFEQSVEIPEDMVMSGNIALENDMSVNSNRVFLDSDLNLKTRNHNLSIISSQLIAMDGAKISNFDANSKAGAQQTGRDGGKITISAKDSLGKLEVVLNSEAGGDGILMPALYKYRTYWKPLDAAGSAYEPQSLEIDNVRDCNGSSGAPSGVRGSFSFSSENKTSLITKVTFGEAPGGKPGPHSSTLPWIEKNKLCLPGAYPAQLDPNRSGGPAGNWFLPRNIDSACWNAARCELPANPGANGRGGQSCIKNSKEDEYVCKSKL